MGSNIEDESGDHQENESRETIGRLSAPRLVEGVRDLLLRWLKEAHHQKPWPKMSEAEQRTWINRLNERAELLVNETIEVVSHGDFPVINAMIESFTVKKGEVKVVTKGFADNEMLAVLNDAGEKRVQITVMRNDQFDEQRDTLNPDPDQPGLPGVKLGEAPGFEDEQGNDVEEPPVENPEGELDEGADVLEPKSDQWRGGYNSRTALHERRENPFNPGSDDYKEWMAGWDAAHAHPDTKPFPGSVAADPNPPAADPAPAEAPAKKPRKKAGPKVEPDIEPEPAAEPEVDSASGEPSFTENDGDGIGHRETEGDAEIPAITDQNDDPIETADDAYAFGKWCRADGRGTGTNPFGVSDDFGKAWLRGYSDERRAEKQRETDNGDF